MSLDRDRDRDRGRGGDRGERRSGGDRGERRQNPDELGALWFKRINGNDCLTGEIDGQSVICFKNDRAGENTRAPLYRVYRSRGRDGGSRDEGRRDDRDRRSRDDDRRDYPSDRARDNDRGRWRDDGRPGGGDPRDDYGPPPDDRDAGDF